MTMKVYFKKDKDGHKRGEACFVERSLGRRFCENGVAIPYQQHLDNVYDAEQAAKKAEEKKEAEKIKADEEKKAELLKKKEAVNIENTVSKKPKQAEKSVKK